MKRDMLVRITCGVLAALMIAGCAYYAIFCLFS